MYRVSHALKHCTYPADPNLKQHAIKATDAVRACANDERRAPHHGRWQCPEVDAGADRAEDERLGNPAGVWESRVRG